VGGENLFPVGQPMKVKWVRATFWAAPFGGSVLVVEAGGCARVSPAGMDVRGGALGRRGEPPGRRVDVVEVR